MNNQGGLLKQAGKVISILLLVVAGFFYVQKAWASQSILISEIMVGQKGAANNEFIELFNQSDQEVDLTKYNLKKKNSSGIESPLVSSSKFAGKIKAHGFFLIAHPNYKDAVAADLAYSSASYYISADNTVLLYNAEGQLVDKVGYGLASDYETQAALMPDDGKSLARKIVNGIIQDTPNNNADFEIKDLPEPQNSSSAVIPPSSPSSSPAEQPATPAEPAPANPPNPLYQGGETTPASTTPNLFSYKLGDVVINEFVSDPADEEVEWIELYNATSKEIDLAGWTIEEGSGAKTKLPGILGKTGKEKFFVIEKPKGNLNNKGDIIILRAGGGVLIDQVAYGNWDDGDLANNAPVTTDPNSLARKFDGQNSFNNLNDFAVTARPTKGTSNIIAETDDHSFGDVETNGYSSDIIISEIFPNPVGSDNEAEFIELYNKGDREVNLLGWGIGDESQRKYKFKDDISIKAGEYLAVLRSESKIALNNNGDSVKLFPPLKDEPYQTVKYDKAIEGWSYNWATSSQEWIWSEISTPGKANIIKTINHPPVVSFSCPEEIVAGQPILFDSSDTVDEDGDELKYSWDFGDGIKLNLASPEHTYLKEGNYLVKLTVSDGENEVITEKIIKVFPFGGEAKSGSSVIISVIINEILPDPEGADAEGEWIELKNIGSNKVNLLNWQLDDGEAGSRPYKISSDLWLELGDFYLLERSESGLALNNSNESVRLFNDLGKLVDEIFYEKSYSGESYSRSENRKWFWTTALTPGEENIISVAGSKSNGPEKVLGVAVKSSGLVTGGYVVTTLEKIKELETGDLVKVEGTVAVGPGILGAQYFYIVGSPGVQVYNYKKEFPDLKIGDYIEVSGEISISNGEKRIKTKQKEDMKVIEHRPAPSPEELKVEKITDDYLGNFVSITGEVVDKKGSIIYVDDSTEEIRVYIKEATGINTGEIKEGETLAIAGLVSRTESGIRIMPRSSDDIIKKDAESQGQAGQVLGEVAESDEWTIAARDKKLQLFRYLLVLAGGIIVVLAGLLINELRRKG